MSHRGGYIGFNRTPAGNVGGSASGVWSLTDQEQLRRASLWPGSFALLDVVTGAAAAYSLRNLFSGATTAVVRVRRSSDNTEQDFSGLQVSDGSLATFCGAGNGFIRTWYDQSGNSRNVGQSTTSLQPQIVSSGSVITLNGKPAVDWASGTADKVLTSTITTTTSVSVAAVFSAVRRASGYIKIFNLGADNGTSGYALTPITGNAEQDWADSRTLFLANGFMASQGSKVISSSAHVASNVATQNKLFASVSSAFARMDINGSEISYAVRNNANTSVLTSQTLYLGNNNASTQQFIGRMQEVVIWTEDKRENRDAVFADLNSHYGA